MRLLPAISTLLMSASMANACLMPTSLTVERVELTEFIFEGELQSYDLEQPVHLTFEVKQMIQGQLYQPEDLYITVTWENGNIPIPDSFPYGPYLVGLVWPDSTFWDRRDVLDYRFSRNEPTVMVDLCGGSFLAQIGTTHETRLRDLIAEAFP